jgi:hypothetical protein
VMMMMMIIIIIIIMMAMMVIMMTDYRQHAKPAQPASVEAIFTNFMFMCQSSSATDQRGRGAGAEGRRCGWGVSQGNNPTKARRVPSS